MVDCIDTLVDFIKRNGGFNITSWYKISTIDDTEFVSSTITTNNNKMRKTSISNGIKVDSGELNVHPCFINLTNCNTINNNNCIEHQLDNK